MKPYLKIKVVQAHEIIEHVQACDPLEACGLLAGNNNQVEKILFVENQAQSSTRFVMNPYEQLKAFDWIEDNEMDLLGIFHSHPTGPETVSPTDIAEAAYDVIHVICSKRDDEWVLRGFWIENGEAIEVALQFVE